jgi:hypothetical protein
MLGHYSSNPAVCTEAAAASSAGVMIMSCRNNSSCNTPALLQLLKNDKQRGKKWEGDGFVIIGLLAMARPDCGE